MIGAIAAFPDPATLFEVFVSGLAKASLYAMMALGLTLIFGLLGVLNFAHGSLTMLGAYIAGLVMVTFTGSAPAIALFVVAAVVAGVLVGGVGAAMEVGLIRRLYDRPPIYQILLTFGVTLVIDELARIVVLFYGIQPNADWRTATQTKPTSMGGSMDLLGASIGNLELFQIAWGVATVVAVGRSSTGRATASSCARAARTTRWRPPSASTSDGCSLSCSRSAPPSPGSPARY